MVIGSLTFGALVTASPWCLVVLRHEEMTVNQKVTVLALIVLHAEEGGESASL